MLTILLLVAVAGSLSSSDSICSLCRYTFMTKSVCLVANCVSTVITVDQNLFFPSTNTLLCIHPYLHLGALSLPSRPDNYTEAKTKIKMKHNGLLLCLPFSLQQVHFQETNAVMPERKPCHVSLPECKGTKIGTWYKV